jgi:NitT/TauT family transport system permease protein
MPHEVVTAFWRTLMDGSLLKHTWTSLVVINLGFLLSSVVAIPLGILMGSYRIVQSALEPVVNFTRYLPVTSMIPLLILWIGIGIEEKIAVIFIGTFFQQIVMVADTSAQIPSELLNAAYTLGAKRRQVLTRVLLPATLPGIMDTLRVTMGWAWTYLVVAELVASNSGLGYMSMQAMRGLHADLIFVAILVIGVLGMITDLLFKWAKRFFLPWAAER